jgi:hypothetical protein
MKPGGISLHELFFRSKADEAPNRRKQHNREGNI